MGIVVNMFELPDSAVLTTAQKAIDAVKAAEKKSSVLTYRKLSVVDGITRPDSSESSGNPSVHAYCRNCGGVAPARSTKNGCPHCGSHNYVRSGAFVISTVASVCCDVLRSVNTQRLKEAEPALIAAA